MKKSTLLLLIQILLLRNAPCQDVLFKTAAPVTPEQLNNFYASMRVTDRYILFNAPDFRLYAFDKMTHAPLWQAELQQSSDIAPFVLNNEVWANCKTNVRKLDASTGMLISDLPIATLSSQPVLVNGKIFGTGIYDGGKVFALDPSADTVVWSRFLAHGSSTQPYYQKTRIVANAEGNNWLEMDYTGKLPSANCEVETGWPSDSPCAKKFITLSHDGKEITEQFCSKLDLGEASTFFLPHKTFLLCEKRLVILGDNLKVILNKPLEQVSDELLGVYGSDLKIIHATDELIWIFESDRIIEYNHKLKKAVRSTDLAAWSPHQLTLDGNNLWLISKSDGQLYCLKYPEQ